MDAKDSEDKHKENPWGGFKLWIDFRNPSLARHQLAMDNWNFSCCSLFTGIFTMAGKVLTMITLGLKLTSLSSIINKLDEGNVLKLCDLGLSKLHSSWIWLRSRLESEADLVKGLWSFNGETGGVNGEVISSPGWPLVAALLGVLRLLGLIAIRWRAAAWFKSPSLSEITRDQIRIQIL